jgi:hypothetical protein
MSVTLLMSSFGAVFAVASVLLLWQSWRLRRAGAPSPLVRLLAWGALVASGALWATGTTADWGIAVALCAFMLAGLGPIGWVTARQPRRQLLQAGKGRVQSAGTSGTSAGISGGSGAWLRGGRRVYVFLLAGPVAGVAALVLTIALYGLAGGASGADDERTAGQLFTALFCFPFLWSLLALVATFDMPLLRRSGAVFGAALVGFVATYGII